MDVSQILIHDMSQILIDDVSQILIQYLSRRNIAERGEMCRHRHEREQIRDKQCKACSRGYQLPVRK
jgi:hypothetical protein